MENQLPEGYVWLKSLDQFVETVCKYVDVYNPEQSFEKLAVEKEKCWKCGGRGKIIVSSTGPHVQGIPLYDICDCQNEKAEAISAGGVE